MGERAGQDIHQLLCSSRSATTLQAYDRALESFRRWQKEQPHEREKDDLTSAAIFLAVRSRSVGSGSMATFISALAYERFGRKPEEAQKWAVLDEMVRGKKRMEGSTQQKFASPHEVETLLAASTTTGWPEWRTDRIRILLVLLFYGLLRISEALNLNKDDVREERKFWSFRIRRSKSDQGATGASIFIQKSVWFDSAFERSRMRTAGSLLLTNDRGDEWSANAASSEIKRRGGATHALEDGTETAAIQRRGRWRNPRSMNPYVSASVATQGGPARIPSDLCCFE
ncbi:site-specific recombinase, phage integrase family [Ancylostoma ceylanicum]|uniref:Site-specific recombinase, phage integrase family n=1 Tax=Ancylostoma ceylanicum TaxID=53326 RepID=A0A0D6LLT5_9BILA|nr:site-specific recombinase, phage integrase family [Ancylostoma ceylanicum]